MTNEDKLQLAKEALASGSYDKETIEYIFPELRESKDEKIRKEIIKLVQFYYGSSLVCKHTVSMDDMVSWLEKQGEQKPAWSEEDKKMKNLIIDTLTSMGTLNLERYHHMNLDEVKNWLKSLKSNHWKPSKEQLEALWDIIPHIPNSERDIDTITELSALYEELKNL